MDSGELHSISNISKDVFDEYLSTYAPLIWTMSKRRGKDKLVELDKFRYGEMEAFRSSEPKRHMELDDVKKLVNWKILHGKYRPSLMKLVSSNDEEVAKKIIQDAMAQYWVDSDVMKAIDGLAKLRGIGPATASLLLSMHDPDRVIFFSDEAYWWLCCDGNMLIPIKYNAKEYKQLQTAAEDFAKRLQVGAQDIDKVAYVIMNDIRRQPDYVADEPPTFAEKVKATTPSVKIATRKRESGVSQTTETASAKRKGGSATDTNVDSPRRSQRLKTS
ncbi:hypothetical protein F4808DRAFT_461444 [Astrocystis sublimbata]|nr:hypothetical protein F4808DRAFT_461444 [Astrocystis sublimbata]